MDSSSHSETDLTALIADLERNEKPIIRAAVNALVPLAQASAELRETLRRRMSEPQVENPWAIAYVLARLPQPSRDVTQRLLEDLGHPDPDIRWAIGLLLVQLANRDEEMTRRLMRLGATGSALQRRMAIYCLRDLSLHDAAGTEIFFFALRDPDPLVRIAATAGLRRKTSMDSREKEKLLKVFLEDPDSRVRSVAAVTLAQRGEPSEHFLRALNRAESSENEQIRRAANTALSLLENTRAAPSGN
ncbi:MAG: HEAT repeat domain-containing protein [Alphaproteobacteria bacterium]